MSIKETALGHHLTAFTVADKNGGSQSYTIGASETALLPLVLAAFAGKRKVRIAMSAGERRPAAITEIEARK